VAYQLLSTAGGRDQLQETLRNQGLGNISIDSLLAMASFCIGCIFVLVVPAITAGVGALGGWLYGLTRPVAPPPAAPGILPPLPPGDAL
jgi:hypothetical protein